MPKKPFFKDFSVVEVLFFTNTFWSALFSKVLSTFLNSVWKEWFFNTPLDLFKEKSFHLLEGTKNFVGNLKGQKWKKLLNISKNGIL